MKVKVNEDRKVYIFKGPNTYALGTQNENDITELEIVVPEQYQDFNKKIVFITADGVVWDIIEGSTYTITKAITKYKSVEFYIWLTKDDKDFRSETKILRFNKNVDPNTEMSEEEINGINKLINEVEKVIPPVIIENTFSTTGVILQDNTVHRFINSMDMLAIVLPDTINELFQCELVFKSGEKATSLQYDESIKWSGDDIKDNLFVPEENKIYNIIFWYDGFNINAVVRGV